MTKRSKLFVLVCVGVTLPHALAMATHSEATAIPLNRPARSCLPLVCDLMNVPFDVCFVSYGVPS